MKVMQMAAMLYLPNVSGLGKGTNWQNEFLVPVFYYQS
jgi:hypothetical protein